MTSEDDTSSDAEQLCRRRPPAKKRRLLAAAAPTMGTVMPVRLLPLHEGHGGGPRTNAACASFGKMFDGAARWAILCNMMSCPVWLLSAVPGAMPPQNGLIRTLQWHGCSLLPAPTYRVPRVAVAAPFASPVQLEAGISRMSSLAGKQARKRKQKRVSSLHRR